MAWYWDLIVAVLGFNVTFLSAAVLRSVVMERRGRRASESGKQETGSAGREAILRSLEVLNLAEDKGHAHLIANQKG